jgi:hypothetical protein
MGPPTIRLDLTGCTRVIHSGVLQVQHPWTRSLEVWPTSEPVLLCGLSLPVVSLEHPLPAPRAMGKWV